MLDVKIVSESTREMCAMNPAIPNPNIRMDVGIIRDDGKATALAVDKLDGSLTVNVMPGAPPERSRPVLVPPKGPINFVNRERELAQLLTALETRRTVLLFGMPGIGKTALALVAAKTLYDRHTFKDGILWVSEIGTAAVDSVCEAIARGLGDKVVAQLPSGSKPDATREALARFPDLLVVLDGLESSDTAQTMADSVIPENLGLLVTSRTHLSSMELDIPIGALAPASAVNLFCDTAKLVQGDNPLSGEICTQLDYHPLALVIAACRVHIEQMPLQRLKNRLEKENMLAALELGDGKDKNRSIWASLNVSYAGLNSDQCQVLTYLAGCFGATTGIELLAEVCALSVDECEDHIGQLVERSLVERSGERLALQRLVRDFGRDALGEQLSVIQDKLIAATCTYLSRYTNQSPAHHTALELEVGNLLGAVRYAVLRKDWTSTVVLTKTLGLPTSGMLSVRGYWTELVEICRLGIQAATMAGDTRASVRFKHNLATSLTSRGEYAEARRLYEEDIAASTTEDDQQALAATWHNLGALARMEGDYATARTDLLKSQSIKQKPEYERYLASTQHELGQIAAHQSDLIAAQTLFEASRQLDEKYQNRVGVALNQEQLGRIKQLQGDPNEARRLYLDSWEVYRQSNNKDNIAGVQLRLGQLSCEQGDYDQARDLLQQSMLAGQALGAQDHIGKVLYELGVLAQEQGQRSEAHSCYERSLKVASTLHAIKTTAHCQLKLGTLAREDSQHADARRLCDEARSIFERLGDRIGLADSLHELGCLAQALEKPDEAKNLLEQSLRIRTEVGYKLGVARSLFALGQLAQAQRSNVEAKSLYEKSLAGFEVLASPQADIVRRSLKSLA